TAPQISSIDFSSFPSLSTLSTQERPRNFSWVFMCRLKDFAQLTFKLHMSHLISPECMFICPLRLCAYLKV
ncbi:hypothetical protein PENTCL1PPCAC_12809, partial [Pristionchus entomophagus]